MGIFVAWLSVILFHLPGQAFLWTGESAEIIPQSGYRLSALTQLKLSNGTGLNLAAGLRTGWTESTTYGAFIGLGDTDFFGNAHLKWTPIPDFESQPAVGFKFEGLLARKSSDTQFGARVHGIVSKKFERSSGLWIPFASLPLGILTGAGRNDFISNLALGSEYFPKKMSHWSFTAEVGLNLSQSFSYAMAIVSYDLDGQNSPNSFSDTPATPRRPTRKIGR
ncbi:MAG: hypothetical protein WCH11_02650 [Bdellovibrio sp.]